jgi:hypothetical protein
MVHVKVYQYDYYDPLLKRDRRSIEFATADTIMERGGTIIAESVREVDEDLVDETGVIAARDLPPRGEFRKSPAPPRARPDDRRVGPG